MALLPVLIAPDPRLKLKAKPVVQVDAKIRRLMDDMLETMYVAPGIGLAAPQVHVPLRLVIFQAPAGRSDGFTFRSELHFGAGA